MRKARIFVCGRPAGILEDLEPTHKYRFTYASGYDGPPVSLTMPVSPSPYEFDRFPPFFDGLLPEGVMLEGLLRQRKIDARDYFGQLIAVGVELVGAVTAEEITA